MYILEAKDFFSSPADTVAVVERNPQEAFPEHAHDFGEIVIVNHGGGCNVINDHARRVCAGSVFYLMPDDRHAFDEVNDLCLTNVMFRMPERYSAYLQQKDERDHGSVWEIGSTTRRQVDLLLQQLSTESDNYTLELARSCYRDGLFLQLIALLCQARYTCNSNLNTDSRARELVNFLRANFAEEIDWDALAVKFGLSMRSLQRKITDQTGLTPVRYLNQLRLAYACDCLQQTKQSITEIAFSAGFEDSNYFSTVFRQEFAATPSQYRARYSAHQA